MTRARRPLLALSLAIASAAGCRLVPVGNYRFSGTYTSMWGDTVLSVDGDTVKGVYPDGTFVCGVIAETLDCTWTQGSMTGKARFARRSDGTMSGTWGSGASATNGGTWDLTPK